MIPRKISNSASLIRKALPEYITPKEMMESPTRQCECSDECETQGANELKERVYNTVQTITFSTPCFYAQCIIRIYIRTVLKMSLMSVYIIRFIAF
jgi:hypothetical protein